jgi:hypothetical protein
MTATTFVRLTLAAMISGALRLQVSASARACSPGTAHPEYANIVCNSDGETWKPAAGYYWAVPGDNSDFNVRRLVFGDLHPTYPNVVWTDGGWRPMTGYEWANADPSDLSVRPIGGAADDQPAAPESTALEVENNTDNYITVSVDGAYGCNTAGFTTCTIPVEVGPHNLYAVKTENGAMFELDVFIDADGYRWIIAE